MTEPTTPPAEVKKPKRAPRKAAAAPPRAPTTTTTGPAPVEWPEPADVPVRVAWRNVMRDVGAIGKDSHNKDQHFDFRGIDATMNTVGPIFRKHGVYVLPVGVEIIESERYESKRGSAMHGMVTRHDWLIVGPQGDEMRMRTLGQAADSSDKVATKAASVAYRTALLQSLTVPTGERDPDADTHERRGSTDDALPPPTDPRQEWWDKITATAATGRRTPAEIRKHYAEKMGHEIDGPEATPATLEEYHDKLEAGFAEQRAKLAEQAAGESTEPAAAEPVAAPEAPANPPAAEPAGDPRRALWREIKAAAVGYGWSEAETRADFLSWAAGADTTPLEIDGADTTPDALTRYVHAMKERADR